MEKNVSFQSEDLKINGIIYLPSESGKKPGVIVLHPHPAFGGSMENNVVNAVCEALQKNGVIAFKFNIRNPNIKKAIRHTITALDFFTSIEKLDESRIGVCGYSWGSRVILEALYNEPRIKILIGVSPPISMFKFGFLLDSERPIKPILLTVGTHDQIIPVSLIEDFFNKLKDPKEFETFNTDHIYIGAERKLSERVIQFVQKYL
ncbi:MAG: dienelactone hydrolase family protein [Candidatus Helarchaeota archaeon]|nr:dienelactone hydrolase family protein [Candidatus Helarchaeota archaeon]